jgi:outer membrane protein OmpA-like peptidoglycan-associated protein
MRTTILTLAAVALTAAGPVFAAGGAKGDLEIGVYGGYQWLDDHAEFRPKDHPFYGARAGYFISRHFGIEGMAQRVPTKQEEDLTTGPLFGDTEMDLDSFRGNLMFNFAVDSPFRPFLTAGLGYEKFEVEGVTSEGHMGYNAGAGFRVYLAPAFNVRADGRYVNAEFAESRQKNFEATLGFGLTFGGMHHMERVEAPPPAPNQPPTVTCSVERSEIHPGETVNVTATASDPEGDPLTYEWSTDAGHVVGNAATAALDFNGITGPSNATITVRVTDTHGNTATSTCGVAMAAPPKAAEAIACMAGGFPRNLSRITNVDKACLDDVAQRLSSDPRATVVIVGHTDTGERSTTRLAQQRAAAVRSYLRERNVEESRITIRTTGSSTLTTGENNRRVEVWFVPDGATIPE